MDPSGRRYGVRVVLSGHEHVYERVKPHDGVYYFVSGSGGQLRPHDLRSSADTEKGFDNDQSFMIFEINGDSLYSRPSRASVKPWIRARSSAARISRVSVHADIHPKGHRIHAACW